jgi:hypothetical protein
VGEVGVHLHDQLGARLERVAEPGHVGLAEPLLAGPVQNLDRLQLRGQVVGQLPGSVGRVVIDDQDRMRAGGRLLQLLGRGADYRRLNCRQRRT